MNDRAVCRTAPATPGLLIIDKFWEIQHLTGHQIATLAQKVRPFCATGGFGTLVELHFLVFFALQS